jgi:hypothetical protein
MFKKVKEKVSLELLVQKNQKKNLFSKRKYFFEMFSVNSQEKIT